MLNYLILCKKDNKHIEIGLETKSYNGNSIILVIYVILLIFVIFIKMFQVYALDPHYLYFITFL